MSTLVQQVKDKDVSLKKSIAKIKSLEAGVLAAKGEQASAPLEVSQRAVIRDLTARCNQLAHEKAELKAERERYRQQLATLRASLGSVHPAAAGAAAAAGRSPGADSSDSPSPVARPGSAAAAVEEARAALRSGAAGPAKEAPEALGEAKGLVELLAHHMDSIGSMQQRIGDVASRLAEMRFTGGTGALAYGSRPGQVGRLFVDDASRQVLIESSAQIASELSSMQSALRLLVRAGASSCTWFLALPACFARLCSLADAAVPGQTCRWATSTPWTC